MYEHFLLMQSSCYGPPGRLQQTPSAFYRFLNLPFNPVSVPDLGRHIRPSPRAAAVVPSDDSDGWSGNLFYLPRSSPRCSFPGLRSCKTFVEERGYLTVPLFSLYSPPLCFRVNFNPVRDRILPGNVILADGVLKRLVEASEWFHIFLLLLPFRFWRREMGLSITTRAV